MMRSTSKVASRQRNGPFACALVIAAAFLVLAFALVSLCPLAFQDARAQSTSVTVANIAPEFAYVNIQRLNGHYNVKLTASDYNGWGDIGDVAVEVYNAQNDLDASFKMTQTGDGSGNYNRVFNNTHSDWLDTETSTVLPWQDSTYRSLCWLNVSFIMLPSDGASMHITIRDNSNVSAEHWAPFSSAHDVEREREMVKQLTVFASFIAATVLTAVILAHRLGRNKVLKELHHKAAEMGLNGN